MDNGTTSNLLQMAKVQATKTGTQTQTTTTQEDESDGFDRLPQAKVRIPECGLQPLIDGLSEGGLARGFGYTIQLVDDGILVSLNSNVGLYPDIRPFPIDIFIPVSQDQMPKVQNDDSKEGIKEISNGSDKGNQERKAEGTERSVNPEPSRVEDITLASDGNSGGTTGLSSGLGNSDGSTETPRVSSDSVQPSIREDVSNHQPPLT